MLPPGATEAHTIAASGTDGRYASSGHIVFTRQGLLMATRFDLDQLSVAGEPVAVFESVMEASGSGSPGLNTGAAQFDLARNGTLIYAAASSLHWAPPLIVQLSPALDDIPRLRVIIPPSVRSSADEPYEAAAPALPE